MHRWTTNCISTRPRASPPGNWLGEYNYLTLSKHPLFALWLAALQKLGLPYLIAGQLLWTAAALAMAAALAPC